MVEWRFGRGWSEAELERHLDRVHRLDRNFDTPPNELSLEGGWDNYGSDAVLAREPPGPPLEAGPFQRARVGVENYAFSDPEIVTAHFDPAAPLPGRRMLLEFRVLGLRYLCGVVVGDVWSDERDGLARFGFRYDTLRGHIERGAEWFMLDKNLGTGEIRYRIEAYWRPGDFPNAWSRIGFALLAPRYQREWHHRAQRRLHLLARHGSLAPPRPRRGRRLVHEGPDVVYRIRRGVR